MYSLLIILFSMINYKIREDNLHYKQAREDNLINCSLIPPPQVIIIALHLHDVGDMKYN